MLGVARRIRGPLEQTIGIFCIWTRFVAVLLYWIVAEMCPSVWLTLDALASRQQASAPTASVPVLSQYIGGWLDKLRANRECRPDEYSSSVQFAVELTADERGGRLSEGPTIRDPKEVRSYEDEQEVIGKNIKGKRKSKRSVKREIKMEDAGFLDTMEDLKPLVDCSFDLPKSQVGCQRLMGTNVVRLTDKSFMQELRRRIKEDYNAVLQKRIAVREAKEIERERTLAISSRTGCIPQTLAGRPVNLLSKTTNGMARSRAKLKTNTERNAERLIRQGIKWEKERLISYELEKKKLLEAQQRREEELMIDRMEELNSKGQYLKRHSANLPKTQIEDLPATDNKLESIVDVPGASVEDEEQETDEGESDDLIHDDDGEGVDADQGEHSEESGPGEADKGIKESASGTVIYTENASQAPNPTPGIILTGDGIIERLMAAETVDEMYRVAEEIIGKTKAKRMKNLLST